VGTRAVLDAAMTFTKILVMIKSRMRLVGHVALMGDINAYRILVVRKPGGKRAL
jgi:hypothetical protein